MRSKDNSLVNNVLEYCTAHEIYKTFNVNNEHILGQISKSHRSSNRGNGT